MPVMENYKPGMFCWPELATSDASGAKKFYGDLFGWSWNDLDMGGGKCYTMIRLQGKDIGALYDLTPEMRQQGVPPHWFLFVSVTDAAASMEAAKNLGAKILYGPHAVGESGSAGGFQDPQGAAVGVWQPNQHIGSSLLGENGTLCWSELATTNKGAARDFYSKVFGWGMKISQMGPIEYTEWQVDGQSVGGMMEMTEEWGGIPPHWMPYFQVADCAAIVEKATALGGSVKVPPTPIPNIGTFAVLGDAQQGVFSVIHLSQM
jgi:hypothetical protein